MKLKKFISLALAAAMLSSTAALPVAADDAGTMATVTSYFSSYDTIYPKNLNKMAINTTVSDYEVNPTKVYNTGSYEEKTYSPTDFVAGRKDFETSVVINTPTKEEQQVTNKRETGTELKDGTTSTADKYFTDQCRICFQPNDNTAKAILLGFSAYSTGSNKFSLNVKYNDETWINSVEVDSATLKFGTSQITASFEPGWHDYSFAITPTKYYVYVDGQCIAEQTLTTEMTKFNYANLFVPYGHTVAFDDTYVCTSTDSAAFAPKVTGNTTMASTDDSYEVNLGSKGFQPAYEGSSASIANAVQIYKGTGSDKVEMLDGITKSYNNDTWKDVITLSGLSLEPNTTYTVEVSGLNDAFGTAVTKTLTFETEKTYTVTANCNTTMGTVEFVDDKNTAPEGGTVTVKATPKDGYSFTGWTTNNTWKYEDGKKTATDTKQYLDGTTTKDKKPFDNGSWMQNPITYTVPAKDVTMTANFVKKINAFSYDCTTTLPSGIAGGTQTVEESGNVDHGKVLQIAPGNFLNLNLNTSGKFVYTYSLYVPADETDATKVKPGFKVGGFAMKGLSGAWSGAGGYDSAYSLSLESGTTTGLQVSVPSGKLTAAHTFDTEKKDVSPGWHRFALAFDAENKTIRTYMDDELLSTAENSYLTGINYLNYNNAAGSGNNIWIDDIALYYGDSEKTLTGDEVVAKGTTTYTVDMGQKVAYEGTTVPGEIYLGSTKVSTGETTITRGVASDKLTFTLTQPLESGTYSVSFTGLTDLFGNAITDRVGFIVPADEVPIRNITIAATEGGKVKTDVGGEVASVVVKTVAGKDVQLTAIAQDGYRFVQWEIKPAGAATTTNFNKTITYTVEEKDAEITAKFEKLAPINAFYNSFETLPTNNSNPFSYNESQTKLAKVSDTDAHGNSMRIDGTAASKAGVNLYAKTAKTAVYGFSFYAVAPETMKTGEVYLSVSSKCDAPNTWNAPYSQSGVFQLIENGGKLKARAFGSTTNYVDIATGWNDVTIGIDYTTRTLNTFLNGTLIGTKTVVADFDITTRLLIEAWMQCYIDDMYLYYPGEVAAVSAPATVETHTTEYVVDMGQKVFGATAVELQKDGAKVDGVTVSVVSEGSKDKIKLTFAESLLEAGKTYTVKLSNASNANGVKFTDKTFNVIAKQQKVNVAVGNSRMGSVTVSGVDSFKSGDKVSEGTVMTLTPVAETGYTFAKWSASGVTLTDAADNKATFTVPHDKEVTVKAIFKATNNSTMNSFYYEADNWDGKSSKRDGIDFYLTSGATANAVKDAAHGSSILFNQTPAMSVLFNAKDNAVFGFDFHTDNKGAFKVNATGKDPKDWGDNGVSNIVAVNAPSGGKQTMSVLGGTAFEIANGWHNVTVAADVRNSTIKVWVDGVERATKATKWRIIDRFIFDGITVAGFYVDNLFAYKEGGNAIATGTVKVSQDLNYYNFNVGEKLYGTSVEVKKGATTATAATVTAADGYTQKVTLASGTWGGDTYEIKVTGKDAFGKTVTKTVTVQGTQMYTVTAASNNAAGGSAAIVTTGDAFEAGTTVSIKATPNEGYIFRNWTVTGGATCADANAKETTITIGSADVTVTANFELIPKNDVTAAANDAARGTVTASTYTTASQWNGAVTGLEPGTVVRVDAVRKDGYKFVNWTATGVTLSETQKTSNALFFEMGNDPVTITANFETYTDGYPVRAVPFYYDFESTYNSTFGLMQWDATGNATTANIIARNFDETHGRALEAVGTNSYVNTDPGQQLSEQDWVFGFDAYLTANSAFQVNEQGKSGKWADNKGNGKDSLSGIIQVNKKDVYAKAGTQKTEDLTAFNADRVKKTLTDAELNKWHNFVIGFDYASHKVMIYMDGKLFSTVQMNDAYNNAKRFNISGVGKTAFDNVFGYYMAAAELKGEDNVKHDISTYDITTAQILDVATGAKAVVTPKNGTAFDATVSVSTNKANSTITLGGLNNKLTDDTEYTVTFVGVKTMLNQDLGSYTFKTRSTKPEIVVSATETKTLPQDTVTDIDIKALNLGNGETLEVYQNGEQIQNIQISGVDADDMTFTKRIAVTLAGGDNLFEVKNGETVGTLTVTAKKFKQLQKVLDNDFESATPTAGFGTVSAAGGSYAVSDCGDGIHNNILTMTTPSGVDAASPYVVSPTVSRENGLVMAEGDFRFESEGNSTGIFNIKDNSGQWCSQFYVTGTTLYAYGTKVMDIELNKWYRMKYLVDLDNHMIYYYVDGRLVAEHTYTKPDGEAFDGYQYWNQQTGTTGYSKKDNIMGVTRILSMDNVKMYLYAEEYGYTVTASGTDGRVPVENGEVVINFTQAMNAETLADITVTDESGNAIEQTAATLSADGKTYTITLSKLIANAPYYVNVPETVLTNVGASGTVGSTKIMSEKPAFAITDATATLGSGGSVNVNVKLQGAVSDSAKVVVYAYDGAKLVGVNYVDADMTTKEVNVLLTVALGTSDLTIGVSLVKDMNTLQCIDYFWDAAIVIPSLGA